MIQIKFKNLEKSELVEKSVHERIEAVCDKFPDLNSSKIVVTLQMDNSPTQPGPDLFKVKIHISGGRYKGITLQKSSSSLYVALADVVDHALEKINRFGDRKRVKDRSDARKALKLAFAE